MVKAGDYYAEGGATEAYCNRAVCPSVSVSCILILARWKLSAETINYNHNHTMFARICIDRTFVQG